MSITLYADSVNEYITLLSEQRKLGKHSKIKIKLPTLQKKNKVKFPSDEKTLNRWKGY